MGEDKEIEHGGTSDRPELQKAILDCRLKVARLTVATLYRLSPDLYIITVLQKAGIRFVVAGQPDMNELTVYIFAAVVEQERKMILQRTKDALAITKERCLKLGNLILREGRPIPGSGDTDKTILARVNKADNFTMQINSIIFEVKAQGADSLREIAIMLNDAGYQTAKGGKWHTASVSRIQQRNGKKEEL